jgi:hypothetical protein
MAELYLSEQEIADLTGYARPAFQLKVFKALGIPAIRRFDNTVLVMRMHCIYPMSMQPIGSRPKLNLGDDGPQIKSLRNTEEKETAKQVELKRINRELQKKKKLG